MSLTGVPNRTGARGLAIAALVAGVAGLAVPRAEAIDLHRKWTVGVRYADFLPQDKVGGGFRVTTQTLGARSENPVRLSDEPYASLSVGYGVKKWEGKSGSQDVQMTMEFTVGRISSQLGLETGFIDENASTRIDLPGVPDALLRQPDGDENFEVFPVADVTLTPIMVNALFHWGSPRADFYTGLGFGMVMAEASESSAYRAFLADYDGQDDVKVKDVAAVNIKLGANVRLTKSDRWYMFFEAEYFATQLLGSGPQVKWPGGEAFLGTRDYDSNNDGTLDTFGHPSDFHLVDPGSVRLDGASAGIGLRYRFGGKERATPAAGPPVE